MARSVRGDDPRVRGTGRGRSGGALVDDEPLRVRTVNLSRLQWQPSKTVISSKTMQGIQTGDQKETGE